MDIKLINLQVWGLFFSDLLSFNPMSIRLGCFYNAKSNYFILDLGLWNRKKVDLENLMHRQRKQKRA